MFLFSLDLLGGEKHQRSSFKNIISLNDRQISKLYPVLFLSHLPPQCLLSFPVKTKDKQKKKKRSSSVAFASELHALAEKFGQGQIQPRWHA